MVSPLVRLSTALIPINVVRYALGARSRTRIIVRIRLTRAATLTLWFLLLTAASVHAQAPQAVLPERRSPLSEITHDFTAWLSHVTGSANHHRAALSPPLPRSRPAELAPAPVASNKEPSELAPASVAPKKKTPAVLIND